MITSIGRKLLTPVLGKARFQPLFKSLYNVALAGLNIGEGAHPLHSGEEYVMEYIQRQLAADAGRLIIFDVGANVGQYNRTLLATFGSQARIWAFEPSHATYQRLVHNLGLQPLVTLENMGLSETPGELTLFSAGAESKLASVYQRQMAHQGYQMTQQETVVMNTLDAYCADRGIAHIHLLKLDVEGHELQVLRGARTMLAANAIDFIQFEFGAAHIDARTYFKDFYNLLHGSYRLYRVLQDGLWPIEHYTETCEVFKRATNFLAERRP